MQLAEQLRDKGIEALFVSPLIRAQETATILRNTRKQSSIQKKRLENAIAMAFWTGMIKSEAKEKYPEAAEQVKCPQTPFKERSRMAIS